MGVLAVATTRRHVKMGESPPRFPIKTRDAIMAISAGFFAIVAANTEILIDQQHVSGFADAIIDQEVGNRRIHVDHSSEAVLFGFDKGGEILALAHRRLGPRKQLRLGFKQPLKGSAFQLDHLGLDRGTHGLLPDAIVEQFQLTNIVAGRHVGQKDGFSADRLFHDD